MADKKEMSTALSLWTNQFTNLVTRDFAECGVEISEYTRTCGMNAMTNIYTMLKDSGANPNDYDKDSIRNAVGQAASLQLNANARPAECFFQARTKKVGNNYVKCVEMQPMGAGNDAMLRRFGEGVEKVYPAWVIHEGDDYAPPRYKGIEIAPPEWTPKNISQKVIRVVYPVRIDGEVQYLIAERESVKTNLFYHVKNNLLNETFGICENRYKASPKQKDEITAKKKEIYDALNQCETVDDMLACEIAKPYMSAAWLESSESMITRKLRNNATRSVTKNYDTMAHRSMMQLDEVYQSTQEEIEENANTEDFDEVVIDVDES